MIRDLHRATRSHVVARVGDTATLYAPTVVTRCGLTLAIPGAIPRMVLDKPGVSRPSPRCQRCKGRFR